MIFTSGGSEANCLALKGAVAGALAAEDRITRLFVSAIEHESVRATAAALAETIPGLKVSTIPVTSDGVIDLAAFRLQLMQGKGRALVSVMAANNETGVIQDLAAVKHVLATDGSEGVLLHVDAVQAVGRIPISFDADYMTISAHKLGGPQGAGALVVKDDAPLAPLITGGGQESGRRAGTENVAAIAGFGAAAQDAADLSRRAAFGVVARSLRSGAAASCAGCGDLRPPRGAASEHVELRHSRAFGRDRADRARSRRRRGVVRRRVLVGQGQAVACAGRDGRRRDARARRFARELRLVEQG